MFSETKNSKPKQLPAAGPRKRVEPANRFPPESSIAVLYSFILMI